jgi:hypothetical protein
MAYDIRNNEPASRYETTVEGHLAESAYDLEPGSIVFTHTVVPDELSGRGIASELVKFALDDARSRGLKVVPQCAYVSSWIARHPEYQDLLRK